VHFVLGTKAQYIKMAPLVHACMDIGLAVHIIDTGQHAGIAPDLRRIFSLPEPRFLAPRRSRDVAGIHEGIGWLWRIIRALGHCKDKAFRNEYGPVLVHGDTISTWLGARMGRIARLPVVHIEAGLRSWRWWHPFPEEIIRVMVMRMSHYLVAPSKQAQANITRMGLKDKCIFIPGNTVEDAVAMIWKPMEKRRRHVLACIHRMETLQNKRRLVAIMDNLIRLQGSGWKITFVQHPATEKIIAEMGYSPRLEKAGICVLPLQPYDAFLGKIGAAEIVIADGGSIQEECALLGKPCLVPRVTSERNDGLGRCVSLVDTDWDRWQEALAHARTLTQSAYVPPGNRPCHNIALWLRKRFFNREGRKHGQGDD